MTFAVATAYAGDHAYTGETLTLTYAPLNPSGSLELAVKAVRESVEQEAISGNDYAQEGETTVFHVWDSTLGSIEPKNGDRITDPDGDFWFVKTTGKNGREPLWRLGCRKAVS